jgi:uncharacterized OB-fold protein
VSQPLRAPLEIGFDYTRSLGPTLSQFMTALADRRILGARAADGRVHAPPFEYDPVTFAPPADLVDVGSEGSVTSWSWMPEPLEGQPLANPFAWALIRLDGADTALLHAVDAGSPAAMRTGMRVRVRWAASPVGNIRDIACFEPYDPPEQSAPEQAGPEQAVPEQADREQSAPEQSAPEQSGREQSAPEQAGTGQAGTAAAGAAAPETPQPVTMITAPVRLHYEHTASPEESSYLRGLAAGRLLGQRCRVCGKVYIPPRGACPTDGVPTTDEVELPDTGTVTTFCVVNVPYPGQRVAPPYVTAAVLLDGADIAFQHLILGCEASEVRMGMRVTAVWRPRDEWGTTPENIDHFRPTGEPDAPYEYYAHHL